jgi:hypothetical protein
MGGYMRIINAPSNQDILGNVKPGLVVRHERKFFLVTGCEERGLILLINIENGGWVHREPTIDVAVFEAEVILTEAYLRGPRVEPDYKELEKLDPVEGQVQVDSLPRQRTGLPVDPLETRDGIAGNV